MGLVGNPFPWSSASGESMAISAEIRAAAHRLLSAIDAGADKEVPAPIWVQKSDAIPSYYYSRAIAEVESILATDVDFAVLHAYVQLFMMRRGRVRAALAAAAERFAFTQFEKTMAAHIERILANPDESLPSFSAMPPGALERFAERFVADPETVAIECIGDDEVERRPELTEVADMRLIGLETDVDAEEGASVEWDASVGDAPGTAAIVGERSDEPESDLDAITDYIIDYTRAHYSPVIARALRQHKDRGLVATINELQVTKAPTKTLAAIARMAAVRFRKLALIYDGFEQWMQVPEDIRAKIVASLTGTREATSGDALMVMLMESGSVDELQAHFADATHVSWDFRALEAAESMKETIEPAVVDGWLASAALEGRAPMTVSDPVIAALVAQSPSVASFVRAASAAVEDAVDRGSSILDDAALEAGRSHLT